MAAIIDDDERTAEDLWEEIWKYGTTENTQAVINLHQDLEKLQFKEEEDWEKHIVKFNDILGQLEAFDSPVLE